MRAVIYTRVSSKAQVDKYSLPAQEKILKECIAKESHELVGMYTDSGISGERIIDRPEFIRLLDDAENKKFDGVWIVDQDRLSRGDLADLSYMKAVFRNNNIQICTPYQKLTLTDVDDDFISDLLGILAKRERVKIKQRADRGRNLKAEKGEWGGRTAPFGYSFTMDKNKHLVIDEDEAMIYREIVSLFLDKCYGIKKIAAELNAKGCVTRIGKPWCMQVIHYILRNSTYKGILVHQKFKPYYTKANKKGWYSDKAYTEIPNAHPALISEETFNLIQARLKKNRSRNRSYLSLQLLTGILECPLCHSSFKVGSTSFGKYRRWVYRCKTRYSYWFDKSKPMCSMNTLPLDEYNEKIWKVFQETARRPELIKQALEEAKTPHFSNLELCQSEYNQVTKKLKEFQTYKDSAVSLRVRGIISDDEFNKQIISIGQEHQNFEQRERELKNKIVYLRKIACEGISEEAIFRYAKFIFQSDKKLNIAQKRKVLEAFVSKIPIYTNGDFELIFKFPTEELPQPQEYQLTPQVSCVGAVKE
jgi:site-specific DNA recombinase